MQSDSFDVCASAVPVPIEALALSDAADLAGHPGLGLAQIDDFDAAKDELIGIGNGQDFG